MPIEYARHSRDTNAIHLDAAGISQEEYIRGEPTTVKPTKDKLVRITRERWATYNSHM